MRSSKPTYEIAPRRLIDGTDRTARLLDRAQETPPPPTALDPRSLVAARRRRIQRKRIGTALLAAAVPLSVLWWAESPPPRISISPEPPRVVSGPAAASPLDEAQQEHDGARASSDSTSPLRGFRSPAQPPPAFSGLPRSTGRTIDKPPRETRDTQETLTRQGAADSPSPEAGERCSERTSLGDYDGAVECYQRKARGDGVAAEWALLEKAKLQNRALHQPSAALTTLNEHERRFPDGVLSREARLSRIELLTTLGKREDALRALDAVLETNQIPERAGELFRLRAQLHADRGDCPRALSDLTKARAHGIARSRTQAVEERCGD